MAYNTQVLRKWAEKSGLKWTVLPVSRDLVDSPDGRGFCCVFDTCTSVCLVGARYSLDFIFKKLLAEKKTVLHDKTLVRKLVLDDTRTTIAETQRHRRTILVSGASVNKTAAGAPVVRPEAGVGGSGGNLWQHAVVGIRLVPADRLVYGRIT
jgi:hypothetical protein